ncbi:hydrolase [Marinobacterium nitratireducens]|uniref:Hydrolase n=1 Tax=Marinobacterium nitratireducens TaxID=518897 RepID=A0A918DUX3_9GAMM|nr:alpha/beta hydrolase [Marinobacterium nitratireducens]GGO83473.1 hydrolase [Marinobacterium nitratireducens]
MQQLLLLPGLLCDRAVWQDQIKALHDIDCRVPDYGSAASIEDMAQIALQDAAPRFALAGHSMGGRVALEICRQAPERVTRLMLLDTGFQPRAQGEAGAREEQGRLALLRQAREHGMREMGSTWLNGMVHPSRLEDSELVGQILAMIERKTPTIFAAQIEALLSRPDASPLLPRLACPTWLVCGREDSWSPLQRHEEMARLVPGSRLEVIEDSGHMTTMERPEAVSALLRQWLEAA